jgi:cell wall assembly regulator SMI1
MYAAQLQNLNRTLREHGMANALPSTAEEIEELRRAIGDCPNDLEEWLSCCRGTYLPNMFGAIHGVERRGGLRSIPQMMLRLPFLQGWIPIATDQSGEYYCLVASGDRDAKHPVLLVDGTNVQAADAVVASSLRRFLDAIVSASERDQYDWYCRKDDVLRLDPDLIEYSRYGFAWQ